MSAKQKLRRENPHVVPRPFGYLFRHWSGLFAQNQPFPLLLDISSILPKAA
jgi:hypothetical protein